MSDKKRDLSFKVLMKAIDEERKCILEEADWGEIYQHSHLKERCRKIIETSKSLGLEVSPSLYEFSN